MSLDPFAAVYTLHQQTVFHHSFVFFHPIVFLLQNLASTFHLLEGLRKILIGLNELIRRFPF